MHVNKGNPLFARESKGNPPKRVKFAEALLLSEEVRKKVIVENYQLMLFIIIIIILKINYLDALAASTILSSLDSKYLDQLKLYLHPALQNSGRSKFVRCWHAKTDGWAASTFHSNCDGKGPTVTIVQVGSYIVGGYTDKSWGGENLTS